jgi:hypothetical protein
VKITERILQIILIAWLLVGQWAQLDSGLPDTGDFSRIMTLFTSGPVGIEPNWPDFNTQHDLWEQRFLHYWLPYWKLDFPQGLRLWQENFNSSAAWLWFPGVAANRLFYSSSVLYLPAVSLLPRLLLIAFMLLVFLWIDRSDLPPIGRLLMTIGLGIPLTMFLTNHNYLVYLNTFFTEPALMSFLLVFLAALIFLKRRPGPWRYVLCVCALFLLSTGKASAIYWPFLGAWFILPSRGFRSKPVWHLARYVLLAGSLAAVAYLYTRPSEGAMRINQYNSLFNGILIFSGNAPARLAELNIPDAEGCVGYSTWTQVGGGCFANPLIAEKVSFGDTLNVAVREPLAMAKLYWLGLRRMQDISFTPASMTDRAAGDSRPSLVDSGWNLWTHVKHTIFPKGAALIGIAVLFLGLFAYAYRRSGMAKELGMVGLICSLAWVADIGIAVLGEGRTDIVKHLFFANYLFDLSLIAAVNGLLLLGIPHLLAARARLGGTDIVPG